MEELKYAALTRKVIGCAMKVHQQMRNGFPEIVYKRCLCLEFEHEGIQFVKEQEISIFYEGVLAGIRKADFLVEGKMVVELKAQAELTDAHLAQALNYLEACNLEVGLLVNFGAKSLQFKRPLNGKYKSGVRPYDP